MLSEDSGIASVTLQQTGQKGLDDVVVRFTSGEARFIQVKHSRVVDTLTFGDLVRATDTDKPLLRKIAIAWDSAAADTSGSCEAWLVTNRRSGGGYTTTHTTGPRVTRPPLEAFCE